MLSPEQLKQYDSDGYLVIENFVDPDTCSKLTQEVDKLIENIILTHELDKIFAYPNLTNIEKSNKDELEYFLSSGDKIRLFMNSDYQPVSGSLRMADKVNVMRKAANKIGHGLHAFNQLFRDITFSQKVKGVVKSLEYKKPIICQSMYCLKQSFSRPDAPGHQDSTYIQVEPNTLAGFWIAMEDITPENGCLQLIPGSHKDGLKRRFVRNPSKSEGLLSYDKDPVAYDQERFVSVPLKEGSAILMNGLVVHRSTSCKAPTKRDAYAFHFYDAEKSEYSNNNWMEFTSKTFLPLY